MKLERDKEEKVEKIMNVSVDAAKEKKNRQGGGADEEDRGSNCNGKEKLFVM